jgi:hypothetical protein
MPPHIRERKHAIWSTQEKGGHCGPPFRYIISCYQRLSSVCLFLLGETAAGKKACCGCTK